MSNRYQNLLSRRSIPNRPITDAFRFYSLGESEDLRYLLGAMDPLDESYTNTCLEEANRVSKHLEADTDTFLQGSVTTNTHIRYHSDIDIVTLSRVFSNAETPVPPLMPAGFDQIAALRKQRITSRETIRSRFYAVTIDDTKPRALSLTGGSLKRKVDIVTANNFFTDSAKTHNLPVLNGIQLLDNAQGKQILNKPLLHQLFINHRGTETNDGAKRAMRLLKTLKVDASSEIAISSYDICAIIWNMPKELLPGNEGASLMNARNVENYLWKICDNNGAIAKTLRVPNGTRNIIDPEGTSVEAIKDLWLELYRLLKTITESGKTSDRQYVIANNMMKLMS